MTAPAFKDHFSGVAADYRAFRPEYPADLFTFLADAAPGRGLVWDCGTGSGQAAVALAGHFDRVFATDASEKQIASAEPHPRVEYAVAPAEACPLPSAAADLITVAQALHWFDHDRFYAEVRRVVRPGGLLAAWTYDLASVGGVMPPALERFLAVCVRPYWPPERAHVDAGYSTIPFPFPELPAPAFEMQAEWGLPRLLGYINTWSAVRRYEREHGTNPIGLVAPALAATWGDPDAPRTVRWNLNLRLGRAG